MKKMEHRSGTFFLDSLHIMHCESALRTAEAAAQQQQHSSSGGSDVAATDEKDERGYTGEPFCFRSCAFAHYEKDERGHTAKSFVDHCCFTVPLNTLRLHSRQYICSDFVFLALWRTSRVVVREFNRASSESFPPSPSLRLADKCAAAVNCFICSLYLYCSLAPLLLLLLLSCSL